ncbi:MAG: hypothetical protein AAF639_20565 [Chloroflexota bacterium]
MSVTYARQQLHQQIDMLPDSMIQTVVEFVEFLQLQLQKLNWSPNKTLQNDEPKAEKNIDVKANSQVPMNPHLSHLISEEQWSQLSEKQQGALSIVGIASSGLSDLGTNHDDYLEEIYAEVKVL